MARFKGNPPWYLSTNIYIHRNKHSTFILSLIIPKANSYIKCMCTYVQHRIFKCFAAIWRKHKTLKLHAHCLWRDKTSCDKLNFWMRCNCTTKAMASRVYSFFYSMKIFMTHITIKAKSLTHILIQLLNNSWTNNKIENKSELWILQSSLIMYSVIEQKNSWEVLDLSKHIFNVMSWFDLFF